MLLTWQGQERTRAKSTGFPLIKVSNFVRLIHYHENSVEGKQPHDSVISHWIPPTTRGNYRSIIQDEIWWGHRAKPYLTPLWPGTQL